MMLHVTRVFLVLVVAVVVFPTGNAARSRSERSAITTDYVPRWQLGLSDRFKDRVRHGLIPLSHVIQFIRPRTKLEYHGEANKKTKQKLAGPDTEGQTIEVCNQDENGFPCDCKMEEEEYFIDCRNESLRTTYIVPTFDSTDGKKKVKVERVNLEGNVITELWKGQIVPGHESTLKQLILRRNSIIYIDEGAFSTMSELVTLDLSFNRLTHLPKRAFADGEGLEWKLHNLYLNDNHLTKVDDLTFPLLTMLKKLVLDNNIGLALTNDTFGTMHELKELSLDGCGLENLPPMVFEKLLNLEYLSLRENPLSVIPAPVKALKSLYALDLSATFISEFTHDALSGEYKLKELIARDMPYLWGIEECAFCGLPDLKEVIFFNCSHLYYIDPNAFGNATVRSNTNTTIELLDFEKCNISSLSGDMLAWKEVKTLKLGGNPFHCDCNLSWMTNQELDYSTGDTTPACASPITLQGRPLNVLRGRELCRGSFRFGRLFVGLTLVLLASAALLVAWYMCSTRGRDGNGFRLRNVFYKPQLPRYGYRNLIVKEDEQALANDDYNDNNERPLDFSRKENTLPPAAEV